MLSGFPRSYLPNTLILCLSTGLKDRGAKDETVKKFIEEEHQRDKWKQDSNSVSHIINRLRQEYDRHKHDFVFLRYVRLKDMIKAACLQNTALKEQSERDENDRLREKYQEDETRTKPVGLLQQAEQYLKMAEQLEEEEQLKGTCNILVGVWGKTGVRENMGVKYNRIQKYNRITRTGVYYVPM